MKIIFPEVEGTTEIYMDVLRAICGETKGKSMLDIGCNKAPHTPLLGFKDRLYIDILPRVLDHPDEQRFFHQKDALHITAKHIVAETTICSDCIEHVSRENGFKLINIMERISYRQVLFTPLDPWCMSDKTPQEDPEGHHSVWSPEDFPGYASIVFPVYHPTLNIGAFFFYRCENLQEDFELVTMELMKKPWSNHTPIIVE